MSTDVEPPDRTSRSGICAATASRSRFFFAPVGSHAVFASSGARWPSAEKVICEPAVLEDVAPRLGFPQPQSASLALDRAHGAGLLIIGERVGIDSHDAAVFDPVILRSARGEQVDVREHVSRGLRQTVDHLGAELLELTARDDRDLHALRESDQLGPDARIDRALGRCQGVIEVERDEPGSGHAMLLSYGRERPRRSSVSKRAEPLCCRGDRI